MAQKLSALPVGAKIKFLTFLGAKVVWRVIGKNLSGMPSNSTTLFMDKIVALRCFDAQEPKNSDSDRKSYGNNDWGVSNLRQWANSSAAAGRWYSAQHSSDAPPDTDAHSGRHNAYQADEGFLADSTQQERDALMATTRRYGGYSSNGKTCTDKLFALTTTELGLGLSLNFANNGTEIPYFASNNSRIAQCTAQCVADSSSVPGISASRNWIYWTATSLSSSSISVYEIGADGWFSSVSAAGGTVGVRLACNLSSDILVSDSTDADGCYTLILNQPPTEPKTITVPETIKSTVAFAVNWDASTDPDSNLTGYILQRCIDDGSWTQVYKGSARTYTDTVSFGTKTVQYRVQAYDAEGSTSAFTTSAKRTVINNHAPKISDTDKDLGVFDATAPKFDYVVTDEDNDSVQVVVTIDGQQTQNFTAQLGHTNSVTYDADAWQQVLNGQHTIEITATDPQKEVAKRKVTFTKKVGTVEFTLAKPLETDAMPTKAIFSLQGAFPAGCTLSVQACNNGLDEVPTWQDVTSAVQRGEKVFFTNEKKTAEKWAVNLKVKLMRGTAQGECYIVSIGGNFR